jgi:tetratricopeptide (TPR) repeat protein
MGWTYYNLGANQEGDSKYTYLDKSLEHFKYSIEKAKKAISFQGQAKNDLILVQSEYKDAFLRVKNYFYKLGGQKESIKRLNNLGELLLAQGKDEDVIEVYRYLITVNPNGKRVPEYYGVVLESQERLLEKAAIDKVYREVIDYFAPGAKWVRANKGKPYLQEGFEMSRKMLQNRAVTFHEQAQKCKSGKIKSKKKSERVKCDKKELYLAAGDLYKEYIDKYPKSKEAYQDSFYYAEILFYHKKDYKKAADYYEQIFKDPSAKAYYADAAFGMILSLEKLMADEIKRLQEGTVDIKTASAAGALKAKKKEKLTDLQRQYVLACDIYIKEVKPNKDTPKVHYGAARLLFERGHYQKAIKRFEFIIKTYRKKSYGKKFASLAGNLILETYNRLKNYEQIEHWSKILLGAGDFTYNKPLKLILFIQQSILKQGEIASIAGKYRAAAEHFLRVARHSAFTFKEKGKKKQKKDFKSYKDYPEVAADALKKAAAAYGFAKDETSANATLNNLIKTYPQSPLAIESLFNLGNVKNMRADFKAAADYFARLIHYYDNKQYTPDALFNAINLYAALGDTKKSLNLIKEYLDIYKHKKKKRTSRTTPERRQSDKLWKSWKKEKVDTSLSKEEQLKQQIKINERKALTALKAEKLDEAQKYFELVIEGAPDSFLAHYKLGKIFYVQKKFKDAEEHFVQARRIDPKNNEVTLLFGNMLIENGRFVESKDMFEDAFAKDEKFAEAAISLLSVYHSLISQETDKDKINRMLTKVEEFAQKALKEIPGNAALYNNLARIYYLVDKKPLAFYAFSIAEKNDAESPIILNNIGWYYEKEGKQYNAKVYYKKALKKKDNYLPALKNLVRFKMKSLNYKESQEIFEKILKLEPNNSNAKYGLALCNLGAFQFEKALKLFENLYKTGQDEKYVLMIAEIYYKQLAGSDKYISKPKKRRKFLVKAKEWYKTYSSKHPELAKDSDEMAALNDINMQIKMIDKPEVKEPEKKEEKKIVDKAKLEELKKRMKEEATEECREADPKCDEGFTCNAENNMCEKVAAAENTTDAEKTDDAKADPKADSKEKADPKKDDSKKDDSKKKDAKKGENS